MTVPHLDPALERVSFDELQGAGLIYIKVQDAGQKWTATG